MVKKPEQIDNISRETDILRKNQKEIIEIKTETIHWADLLVNWTWLKKESLS